jgi:hypothetical protein
MATEEQSLLLYGVSNIIFFPGQRLFGAFSGRKRNNILGQAFVMLLSFVSMYGWILHSAKIKYGIVVI